MAALRSEGRHKLADGVRPGHLRFSFDSLPLNEEIPSTGLTGRGGYDIRGYAERVDRRSPIFAPN